MESKVKRYRLKKDLPTFKAGNMFRLEDTGSLWWHGRDNGQPETKSVVAYQNSTLYKFPNILTDWFEEILEEYDETWHPKPGDRYWAYHINHESHCAVRDFQYYGKSDQRLLVHKAYPTEELARRAGEKELARRKAKVILERDTKQFKPSKKNNWEYWTVYFDPRLNEGLDVTSNFGFDGTLTFATREDAEASIKAHPKEWKIYLGVE